MKKGYDVFSEAKPIKPTTKGYDLNFGAKNRKGNDYSTRYD